MLQIVEHVERERARKEDRLEKEMRLDAAGVEFRNRALSRGKGRLSGIVAVDVDGDGVARAASPSPTGTKTTPWIRYESDEKASETLVGDMEVRQEQENRRLQLDE